MFLFSGTQKDLEEYTDFGFQNNDEDWGCETPK